MPRLPSILEGDRGIVASALGSRASALGGIVGPVAFVGAWTIGGLRTPGYSFVEDAISRLAAVHAPTRVLMSAGFVTFGLALPVFSRALHRQFGRACAIGAIVSGLSTLGVAALPLDVSRRVDLAHGAAATVAYLGTIAMPATAVRTLLTRGQRGAGVASAAVGAMSAACLAATTLGPRHGLFQRSGLGVVDAWMIVVAASMLRQDAQRRSA